MRRVKSARPDRCAPRNRSTFCVGGSGSQDAIRDEFSNADVVLAVGTEFSETDYDFFYHGALKVGGKLIRVDIDPRQLTRNIRPDLPINSDAALALSALTVALSQSEAPHDGRGITRAKALRSALTSNQDANYQAVFATIREALPEVIIAGDSTQATSRREG